MIEKGSLIFGTNFTFFLEIENKSTLVHKMLGFATRKMFSDVFNLFFSYEAQVKFALCACRVDAELGPGGSGKDLVGKGLCTVRARRGTVRARLVWSHLTGSKRPMVACVNHTITFQLDINFLEKKIKKGLWTSVRFKHHIFTMIFQKHTYIG